MGGLPARYTVGVRTYSEGADDAHGNPTPSWAAAVTIAAYGWAPRTGAAELLEAGRDAVITDLAIYAPVPTTLTIGPRDRVVVDGDTYEVVGHPQEFNHGPFGWAPGVQLNVNRVEG